MSSSQSKLLKLKHLAVLTVFQNEKKRRWQEKRWSEACQKISASLAERVRVGLLWGTNRQMHCSTCRKYPELADKSSPMYIGCGDGVPGFRRETLTTHSKSRRHVLCHTRSLNDQKPEDRPLEKICRIFWASSFVVRTSKIHIALVRMDKRIEKKVSCPVDWVV